MDFVPAPSQEDRLMAAACHLSSLVGFGVLAPLAVFFLKRESSPFVARHALQALFLQLAWMIFTALLVALAFGALALFVGASVSAPSTLKQFTGAWSVATIFAAIGSFALPGTLYFVALIFGTLECFQGKEASLPVFGGLARSAYK